MLKVKNEVPDTSAITAQNSEVRGFSMRLAGDFEDAVLLRLPSISRDLDCDMFPETGRDQELVNSTRLTLKEDRKIAA